MGSDESEEPAWISAAMPKHKVASTKEKDPHSKKNKKEKPSVRSAINNQALRIWSDISESGEAVSGGKRKALDDPLLKDSNAK